MNLPHRPAHEELRQTQLQDLNPWGVFDGELGPVDTGTALWYKGRTESSSTTSVHLTFIDRDVAEILRDYAEERQAKGIRGIPEFVPGPIGACNNQKPRRVTEREVADYHRREREGNRKLLLELRARNDADLKALAEGW